MTVANEIPTGSADLAAIAAPVSWSLVMAYLGGGTERYGLPSLAASLNLPAMVDSS